MFTYKLCFNLISLFLICALTLVYLYDGLTNWASRPRLRLPLAGRQEQLSQLPQAVGN